jgi:hypothetical protein
VSKATGGFYVPEADEQSISTGLYGRRAFLLGASTTVTSAQRFAPTAEVISVVPAQRHETEIEGLNLGLLAPIASNDVETFASLRVVSNYG